MTLVDEIRGLAVALMEEESTSGNEGAVIDRAHDLLQQRGWDTLRIPVSPGRDCVLASTSGDPDVTLSTHLDTVPPFIPPSVDGDLLRGRGACDAKGIAASMIVAAERLREQKRQVALLFVVGEETCHDGAHAANQWALRNLPPRERLLINGEPTESTLAVGTKGAQRVVLRTTGKAAHSAYPHMGQSATRDLVRLLSELETMDWPRDDTLGDTTVNIGHLEGGVADNVIAPSAEARLMFRLVTPASEVQERVERWAAGRATLEWGVMVPPVRLRVRDGFPTSVAAFATDIPELGAWGTPCLFGPGSVHVAHTADEHVSLRELVAAVDAYERLAAS
jgi:acetylornithine deacetylase